MEMEAGRRCMCNTLPCNAANSRCAINVHQRSSGTREERNMELRTGVVDEERTWYQVSKEDVLNHPTTPASTVVAMLFQLSHWLAQTHEEAIRGYNMMILKQRPLFGNAQPRPSIKHRHEQDQRPRTWRMLEDVRSQSSAALAWHHPER